MFFKFCVAAPLFAVPFAAQLNWYDAKSMRQLVDKLYNNSESTKHPESHRGKKYSKWRQAQLEKLEKWEARSMLYRAVYWPPYPEAPNF